MTDVDEGRMTEPTTEAGRVLLDDWTPFGDTEAKYQRNKAELLADIVKVEAEAARDALLALRDEVKALHEDSVNCFECISDDVHKAVDLFLEKAFPEDAQPEEGVDTANSSLS